MSKTRNPDALIRIEDAIKVLCREKCYPGAFCPDNYCAEMWDEFEDVERVDAVPVRHGRWEMKSDPYGFFDEIPVCSECGCTTKLREVYKFCPNCGARMDGKDGEGRE